MSGKTKRDERPLWQSVGAAVLLVCLIGWAVYAFWPTPQMGTNEEVFKTVDALFTAVTTRDSKRLHDCDQRLQAFREQKLLPESAARQLNHIVKQAQSGQWEASAKRLYDFMLAQRRTA